MWFLGEVTPEVAAWILRLIEKQIESSGKCPVTKEELTKDGGVIFYFCNCNHSHSRHFFSFIHLNLAGWLGRHQGQQVNPSAACHCNINPWNAVATSDHVQWLIWKVVLIVDCICWSGTRCRECQDFSFGWRLVLGNPRTLLQSEWVGSLVISGHHTWLTQSRWDACAICDRMPWCQRPLSWNHSLIHLDAWCCTRVG